MTYNEFFDLPFYVEDKFCLDTFSTIELGEFIDKYISKYKNLPTKSENSHIRKEITKLIEEYNKRVGFNSFKQNWWK